jgi:hypothetical protein
MKAGIPVNEILSIALQLKNQESERNMVQSTKGRGVACCFG